MSPGVDLLKISRTLERLFEISGREVLYTDAPTRSVVVLSLELATSASGFLPVFLGAANAVWTEATGRGFDVELVKDPTTPLGFRAQAIRSGTFACVMLSILECIESKATPAQFVINDLNGVWQTALRHISLAAANAAAAS